MDEARRHLPRFRSDQVAAQKLSGAGCLSFARRCFSLAGNSSTKTDFADPLITGPLGRSLEQPHRVCTRLFCSFAQRARTVSKNI